MAEPPKMPAARLPRIVSTTVEDDIQSIQFRPEAPAANRPLDDTSGGVEAHLLAEQVSSSTDLHGQDYSRIAGVLEAMFPEGVRLNGSDNFAVFFLFCQLVESLSGFADAGLTGERYAREICEFATRMDELVAATRA